MYTCPQCGSARTFEIAPPHGSTNFFLPAYDAKTNSVNVTQGIVVITYGCYSCDGIFFKDPSISNQGEKTQSKY